MKCNRCGFHNDDKAKYCKKCGKELSVVAERHCEYCGNQLNDQAKYCKYCGSVVEVKNSQQLKQNKPNEIDTINTKSKSNPAIWIIIVVAIVVLIAITVIMSQKQQNSNYNSENQDLIEADNRDNTYNDIYDEMPDENNDEEEIVIEDNNMDLQETGEERDFYSQDVSVEENVLIIREKYNEIVSSISSGVYEEYRLEDNVTGYYDGNELKAVIVSKGTNGIEYTQSYYYDEGNLFFAYYESEDSHRFYFYEEYLMRWRYCANANIPSDAINYDWDSFEEYIEWEKVVLDASNVFKQ